MTLGFTDYAMNESTDDDYAINDGDDDAPVVDFKLEPAADKLEPATDKLKPTADKLELHQVADIDLKAGLETAGQFRNTKWQSVQRS